MYVWWVGLMGDTMCGCVGAWGTMLRGRGIVLGLGGVVLGLREVVWGLCGVGFGV